MRMLILDDAAREALVAVNETTPGRRVAPVPLADGRWAVNADLLDDRETWGAAQGILGKAAVEEVAAGKVMKAAGLSDAAGLAAISARYAVETARVAEKQKLKPEMPRADGR